MGVLSGSAFPELHSIRYPTPGTLLPAVLLHVLDISNMTDIKRNVIQPPIGLDGQWVAHQTWVKRSGNQTDHLLPHLQRVLFNVRRLGRFRLAATVRGVDVPVAKHEHHLRVLPPGLDLCGGMWIYTCSVEWNGDNQVTFHPSHLSLSGIKNHHNYLWTRIHTDSPGEGAGERVVGHTTASGFFARRRQFSAFGGHPGDGHGAFHPYQARHNYATTNVRDFARQIRGETTIQLNCHIFNCRPRFPSETGDEETDAQDHYILDTCVQCHHQCVW